MILALAAPMLLTSPCLPVRSASEVGEEIRHALSNVSAHIRSSVTFGEPWTQSVSNLQQVLNDCSVHGWDGYEAAPICSSTAVNAFEFIRTIPFNLPLPDLNASSAGDITFEWAQSSRRIVTVAIGSDGVVHFATLNGLKKTFGSHPMNGTFDPHLEALIEEILS